MNDLISRQAAIEILATMQGLCTSKAALLHNSKIWQQIKDLPSADIQDELDNSYQHGWTAAEAEYREALRELESVGVQPVRESIPFWYIKEWMESPIGGHTFEDLKSCWLNDVENHNVPSSDVVEVVRCKDCIWRYHYTDGEEKDWCAVWTNEVADKDAFCSYGKGRKDG